MSVLSRYLNPEALGHIADRPISPHGLVIGNLAGSHKSPLSGFAVEFAGHREYVYGDDPKHIDWRIYYTRDKYFVKQYELETNFVCHMLLDISASMRYGDGAQEKLQYAAQLATTLGYSIIRQTDKVSLATFDDRIRGFIRPSNSMDQISRITQHLDETEAVEKTDIADCLNEMTTRMGRREIVFIFSDLFANIEHIESALQQMRYNNHEVVLFQVLHHDEINFEFDGMVKFVGLEVPDELLAQPDDLRVAYLKAFNAFQTELSEVALRNRCEHVVVDTSQSMRQVLIDYLNRRSILARGR